MEIGAALLLANAATTWFMTGLVWYVQIVHYPVFALVGADRFPSYQASNTARTAVIVLPPMLVELASGIGLVWCRPARIPAGPAWAGAALLGAVWISTALLQAPLHGKLGRQFDARTHRVLVSSNWIRTLAWTARAGLTLWMLWTVTR